MPAITETTKIDHTYVSIVRAGRLGRGASALYVAIVPLDREIEGYSLTRQPAHTTGLLTVKMQRTPAYWTLTDTESSYLGQEIAKGSLTVCVQELRRRLQAHDPIRVDWKREESLYGCDPDYQTAGDMPKIDGRRGRVMGDYPHDP